MPSVFSPNKIYQLQATGEDDGTWGVNANAIFSQIDLNLGGRLNLDVSGSSDVTLTTTQARNIYHNLSGTLTGNINYVFPASNGGDFIVKNGTSGAYTVTVKPSGGTGIVVPQGTTMRIFINPDQTAAVITNTVTPTTTRGDMIARGASADQRLPVGTAGQVLGTNGTDPAWVNLIPSGTVMLFFQVAAPTGWTKQTAIDDLALRLVSGTGGGNGGSVAFSTLFARTATDAHVLTQAELPNVNFVLTARPSGVDVTATTALGSNQYSTSATYSINVPSGGSGTGHTHDIDMRVKYADIIACAKD